MLGDCIDFALTHLHTLTASGRLHLWVRIFTFTVVRCHQMELEICGNCCSRDCDYER
jgi:hypothetical protein